MPRVIVVTGVSGSGKTTIGQAVAKRLGWAFQEGDLMHDTANIEKMRNGEALTDQDRLPWLRRVADWIHAQLGAGRNGVVTCSALKRSYRDLLRQGRMDVLFILLQAPRAVIRSRIAARQGHFMPATLLPSQYAAFEPPDVGEDVVTIDAAQSIDHIVDQVIAQVERHSAGPHSH